MTIKAALMQQTLEIRQYRANKEMHCQYTTVQVLLTYLRQISLSEDIIGSSDKTEPTKVRLFPHIHMAETDEDG